MRDDAVDVMQYLPQLNKTDPEPEAEPTTKTCPFCCEEISIKATKCPHCASELPAEEE